MSAVFDTRELTPAVRVDAIRREVTRRTAPVDVQVGRDHDDDLYRLATTALGGATFGALRCNALALRRTARPGGRSPAASVVVSLQVAGSSTLVQAGRVAAFAPGDCFLYDTGAPYTQVRGRGCELLLLAIPAVDLALPQQTVQAVTGRALTPGRALRALVSGHLRTLEDLCAQLHADEAEALERPSAELVRALITSELPMPTGPVLDGDSLAATILDYVRSHLDDRELDAARIADEHHISLRHLYKTLAAADVSLGQWVRTHRLERCRADLGRPQARSLSIAALARRRGFGDPTHFGRLFRQAYGLSPGDYRERARPTSGPPR